MGFIIHSFTRGRAVAGDAGGRGQLGPTFIVMGEPPLATSSPGYLAMKMLR